MPATAVKLSYEDRKVQGICTRSGCRRRASDDSSLCVRHHRADRRASREYKKRLRDERRAAKLCVWCSNAKPAPASEGSTSCLPCRIKRNRVRAADGGVRVAVHDGGRSAAIAAATRKDPDGRTRYHGQQRRGQQTHTQLNAQDLRMATDSWEAFCAGVTILAGEDVKEWHRGKVDSMKIATASQGERCGRHIDDILERLGHFKERHGRRDGEK